VKSRTIEHSILGHSQDQISSKIKCLIVCDFMRSDLNNVCFYVAIEANFFDRHVTTHIPKIGFDG